MILFLITTFLKIISKGKKEWQCYSNPKPLREEVRADGHVGVKVSDFDT